VAVKNYRKNTIVISRFGGTLQDFIQEYHNSN